MKFPRQRMEILVDIYVWILTAVRDFETISFNYKKMNLE